MSEYILNTSHVFALYGCGYNDAREGVRFSPPDIGDVIDVRELIRCSDCYAYVDNVPKGVVPCWSDNANGFCHHARGKEC